MWESTPIINYVLNTGWSPEEQDQFRQELMEMHSAHHKDGVKAVAWMKSRLGRQSYTWVGEYRFWVWECASWRVYVSNIQGISFEVPENLTKAQVKAQWNDFRARLGIFDMFPSGTRVRVYVDDRQGTSLGPDSRNPGCFLVKFDDGTCTTTTIDNIVYVNSP